MIFTITGDGKGKTTSSMGMLSRALGNGMKCAVFQFIKSNPSSTGEYVTFSEKGVEWENFGEGFTWKQDSLEPTCKKCLQGWKSFIAKALSGKYQFIILDEFTYVLENNLLDRKEVIGFLSENKTKDGFPHIVITGRRASEDLIAISDTVSEIREIKHHYNSNGGKTVKGIEF